MSINTVTANTTNTAIANIDVNQINTTERHALETKLDLQITFPAIEYGSIDKETGIASQKQVFVSCKLHTEVNPDDKTAIRFSFMTTQPIKIESRTKNTDGKYIKVATDTYLPAIVYSFGYDFSLTVETHSNLLFPKGGHLLEYTKVTRRDQLARLMEAMLDNGQLEFISTYLDSKGQARVLQAYDDRILLLLALKRRSHLNVNDASDIKSVKQTYHPISNEIVLEAFIEAYTMASVQSVVLPNTTLDTYNRYAISKLAEIQRLSAIASSKEQWLTQLYNDGYTKATVNKLAKSKNVAVVELIDLYSSKADLESDLINIK